MACVQSRCLLTVTASKASYPCCHCDRRGEASLLFVVFVMLSVKLSCWLYSNRVLRRALPLDWARGGRRSLPLRKSATPEPDAPLHTNHMHNQGQQITPHSESGGSAKFNKLGLGTQPLQYSCKTPYIVLRLTILC